jgi:hypothetical protein
VRLANFLSLDYEARYSSFHSLSVLRTSGPKGIVRCADSDFSLPILL